jgi:hypothetical protein
MITFFFYTSFVLVPSYVLGRDSLWMLGLKIVVSLCFLIMLRRLGPVKRGSKPQDERFYTLALGVSMFTPPWGLYLLRRWRPFWMAAAIQAAIVLYKGGEGAYWLLVIASAAVWLRDATREARQRAAVRALKGVRIVITGAAALFQPPLGIVLIPLLFSEGEDVNWMGVALQGVLNAILWWWVSSLPIVGWLGFVAYAHVAWFWWNNRTK